MKASKELLYVVIVQYSEEDDEPSSDLKIKVFPCKTKEAALKFEEYYRKNMADTQLYSVQIAKCPIYQI